MPDIEPIHAPAAGKPAGNPGAHGLRRLRAAWIAAGLLMTAIVAAPGATPPARFPQPEFESPYVQPLTPVPPPRSTIQNDVDVAVLAAALVLASWLVLKRRSRAGIVALSLFSIAYFGFYRQGCVCPIGSIQNVTSALADPAYVIPWSVAAFFLLPLVFAALAGRVFCAGVCPLGVLQDLVVWKPMRVPEWLEAPLRLLPPLYLGLAVLLAATGADYIICRYDPFVGFYRLGGPLAMLVTGAALLLGGMFVGRLYCRFLCPYGVLLGWISRFAYRHATIPPEGCINCRLCEQACPFDCIRVPEPEPPVRKVRAARRHLGLVLAAAPLLVLLGAGLGLLTHAPLSRLHPQVRLAERMAWEDQQGGKATLTVESETFRASGRPVAALAAEAARIRRSFRTGAAILGAFMGLLLGIRWIGLSRWPRYFRHDMDHAECLSCARCFSFCSMDRPRRPAGMPATTPNIAPGGAHDR